jgi:hypothetical protein
MLMVAGFLIYRGLHDPHYWDNFARHSGPHSGDWFASEITLFLAFGIRYLENRALRVDDDSDGGEEKGEDLPEENSKFR